METIYRSPDGQNRIEEDFSLFLQELADLMNKYHYSFHQCQFVKFTDERIKIVEFEGDGQFIYPYVDVPTDLLDKGDNSE